MGDGFHLFLSILVLAHIYKYISKFNNIWRLACFASIHSVNIFISFIHSSVSTNTLQRVCQWQQSIKPLTTDPLTLIQYITAKNVTAHDTTIATTSQFDFLLSAPSFFLSFIIFLLDSSCNRFEVKEDWATSAAVVAISDISFLSAQLKKLQLFGVCKDHKHSHIAQFNTYTYKYFFSAQFWIIT